MTDDQDNQEIQDGLLIPVHTASKQLNTSIQSGIISDNQMTIEGAVREELRDAYHEEIRLFAEFTQLLGKPNICQYEVLHRREQLQEAARKLAVLRTVLHGVLEGKRILQERTSK